jgi:hypothetical protein
MRTSRVHPAAAGVRPSPPPAATAAPPPAPRADAPTPARTDPVVVALPISPILVRGTHRRAATIATGTDVVRLQLQGEPAERLASPARAIVRTVGGRVIWRGPAAASTKPHELARIDVPATRLQPDDYIIDLIGTDAAGRQVELHRYFLSVRAP